MNKDFAKEILSVYSRFTLAKMYNEMNVFMWPDEILEYAPDNLDKLGTYELYDMDIFQGFIDALDDMLSEYEKMEYLHLYMLGSTKEEFDEYWSTSIYNPRINRYDDEGNYLDGVSFGE